MQKITNHTKKGELVKLLQELLQGLTIKRSEKEILDQVAFRSRVLGYRNNYNPMLRMLISTYKVYIDETETKARALKLLEDELQPFIHEGRMQTYGIAINGGSTIGYPIEEILQGLMREAVVQGSEITVNSFYEDITRGYAEYQEYFLLAGVKVEQEVRVFDGVTLIPLPDSPNLPSYLPLASSRNEEKFRGQTLLRIDWVVKPALCKPVHNDKLGYSAEQEFIKDLSNSSVKEYYLEDLFSILGMKSNYSVGYVMGWIHLNDASVFNIFRGGGYHNSLNHYSGMPRTTLSADQIQESVIFHEKLSKIPDKMRERLRIPIERWLGAKKQKQDVDKMIDLGVAFESLYLRKITQELQFRFIIRASLYLGRGKSTECKESLKNKFKAIYDQRSLAVHEGRLNIGNEAATKAFISEAQDLLEASLEMIIDGKKEPDWPKIELGCTSDPA